MYSEKDLKYVYIRRNIEEIMNNIDGKDYNGELHDALEDVLNCFAVGKKFKHLLWFLENIENAPEDRIISLITESSDFECICLLAEFLSNNEKNKLLVERLADIIIQSDETNLMCEFAKVVRNAPIEKLADAVIESDNIVCIINFENSVRNSSINKLDQVTKEKLDSVIKNFCSGAYKSFIEEEENKEKRKKLLESEYRQIISGGFIAESVADKDKEYRTKFCDYLFDNINDGYNELILRVYFDFLVECQSVSVNDAKKLDLEYNNYIKSLELQKVNGEHKKKILSVYSLVGGKKNN